MSWARDLRICIIIVSYCVLRILEFVAVCIILCDILIDAFPFDFVLKSVAIVPGINNAV